ncbi:hypothetical protein B0T10DRAFT_112582 [Thelonectria olida]|uniref:Uncharacterized protein n=1 Tax=Thelonectria olida TaxID=1576542 RepID=A0A9P8WGR0_9HYPO|nr:hypothetical protein B0T10DRAFT_112582 [Thelonectria olida]
MYVVLIPRLVVSWMRALASRSLVLKRLLQNLGWVGYFMQAIADDGNSLGRGRTTLQNRRIMNDLSADRRCRLRRGNINKKSRVFVEEVESESRERDGGRGSSGGNGHQRAHERGGSLKRVHISALLSNVRCQCQCQCQCQWPSSWARAVSPAEKWLCTRFQCCLSLRLLSKSICHHAFFQSGVPRKWTVIMRTGTRRRGSPRYHATTRRRGRTHVEHFYRANFVSSSFGIASGACFVIAVVGVGCARCHLLTDRSCSSDTSSWSSMASRWRPNAHTLQHP